VRGAGLSGKERVTCGLVVVGKALGAVALGVAAVMLMAVASVDDRPMLARWALFVAMCGCTLAIMLAVDIAVRHALVQERQRTDVMLEAERLRMEEILERIAGLFAARERPLRSVDDSH
jgi:peptidoglycan/LPS O-acetylase OafA/YrhL